VSGAVGSGGLGGAGRSGARRRLSAQGRGGTASGAVGPNGLGGVGRSGTRQRLSTQGRGGGRGGASGCSWGKAAAGEAALSGGSTRKAGVARVAQVRRMGRCSASTIAFFLVARTPFVPCE
jgi:hypothetical protein